MAPINEALFVTAACIAGGVFGAIFFGGLWWTVRKGMTAEQPALWFFGSLMARMGITLGGFYFVASGNWERLTACLLGFVIARLVVSRLTKPIGDDSSQISREASHASHP